MSCRRFLRASDTRFENGKIRNEANLGYIPGGVGKPGTETRVAVGTGNPPGGVGVGVRAGMLVASGRGVEILGVGEAPGVSDGSCSCWIMLPMVVFHEVKPRSNGITTPNSWNGSTKSPTISENDGVVTTPTLPAS